MDLKDFVKETILDIAKAIEEANKEAKDNNINVMVNPFPIYHHSYGYQETYKDDSKKTDRSNVEKIEFDVAVTSSNKTDGSVGSSINIVGVKIGADGTISGGTENVSRIKFSIPVSFPNIKK
jgi:hypothetical protein